MLVTDRESLVDLMPRHGYVAEIGVDKGEFSRHILFSTRPKRLHLIDKWAPGKRDFPSRYGPESMKVVQRDFSLEIEAGTVVLHQGVSFEVMPTFKDRYFDWIYLDTSHRYEETVLELGACHTKIKPGGLILGHDYTIGNIDRPIRYGVIQAVNEFCVTQGWELAYLTNESHRCLSFALRQIQ
jgi:hypothetical protein